MMDTPFQIEIYVYVCAAKRRSNGFFRSRRRFDSHSTLSIARPRSDVSLLEVYGLILGIVELLVALAAHLDELIWIPVRSGDIFLLHAVLRLLLVLLVDLDGLLAFTPLDDPANLDVVYGRQQRALAEDLALGEIQAGDCACEPIGAIVGTDFRLGGPRVLEALVDGDACVDVDGQHAVDQVEGWVAD